jgi:hypothetical protein
LLIYMLLTALRQLSPSDETTDYLYRLNMNKC